MVLLGEGHGEVSALPILVQKLLKEKEATRRLPLDKNVIRFGASRVFRWRRAERRPDFSEWVNGVTLAGRRSDGGAVLAIYDGDFKSFPPGSGISFCPATAAKEFASAATQAGAGITFSLSVVFACVEYETWLVAGAESLRGRRFKDGRLVLAATAKPASGQPESHGKRWLEDHCESYRPARDQAALTEMLDLGYIRDKNLRSFRRLEHALDELLKAVAEKAHTVTPA